MKHVPVTVLVRWPWWFGPTARLLVRLARLRVIRRNLFERLAFALARKAAKRAKYVVR